MREYQIRQAVDRLVLIFFYAEFEKISQMFYLNFICILRTMISIWSGILKYYFILLAFRNLIIYKIICDIVIIGIHI